MRIQVTDKHINLGEVSNCEACPVALAVTQAVGEDAIASYDEIAIGIMRFSTPNRVREFMSAFDDRMNVRPFSFNLPWND